MEAQKDGIVVEKETVHNNTVDLDMEKDGTEGQHMTFPVIMNMGENKTVDPGDIQERLSEHEARRIEYLRYQKVASLRDLFKQLARTIDNKYLGSEEKSQLFLKVQNSIKLESQRRTTHEFVASNRHCSQLKKVWMNRGLHVDEEILKSAAASKDAFDMSSLSESLPSKPLAGDDEVESNMKEFTRDFLLVCRKNMTLAREKLAKMPRDAPELNNNLPSCSSPVQQPITLANIVKKAYRDMKNMQHFSFRPPIRSHKCPDDFSKTSVNSERSSVPDTKYAPGKLVFLTIGDNPTQNNAFPLLQDEDLSHFSGFYESLKKVRDTVVLRQQTSRQKIANSKRDGLSESMDESEINEASFDQNNDKQDKATSMLDRKKERRGRLWELLKDTPCVKYKPVINRKET